MRSALLFTMIIAGTALAGTDIPKQTLLQKIAKDSGCKVEEVSIGSLENFDFNQNGKNEAVVVASTCNTGTAGPDVHAVFTEDGGAVEEIPLPEIDAKYYHALFGNRNFTLKVKEGNVIAGYGDTSTRKEPLKVTYKWNGKGFEVAHIEAAKNFKTSFDCEKTRTEIERGICAVETLAELDRKLDAIYKARLSKLPALTQKKFADNQLRWKVRRETECGNQKFWVDCLYQLYQNRIAAF